MVAFFYRMTRRPSGVGRQRLFTQQQELAIVDLVRANNAIRLNKLQQQILADRDVFNKHRASEHFHYQTHLGKAPNYHEAIVQGPI